MLNLFRYHLTGVDNKTYANRSTSRLCITSFSRNDDITLVYSFEAMLREHLSKQTKTIKLRRTDLKKCNSKKCVHRLSGAPPEMTYHLPIPWKRKKQKYAVDLDQVYKDTARPTDSMIISVQKFMTCFYMNLPRVSERLFATPKRE